MSNSTNHEILHYLRVLNRYLATLGTPLDIITKGPATLPQKAVYLAQAAGADLGYDYNWSPDFGPYSKELANDYYKLSEEAALNNIRVLKKNDPKNVDGIQLPVSMVTSLEKLAPLINTPDECPLPQTLWLRLAAAIHWQFTRHNYSIDDVRELLKQGLTTPSFVNKLRTPLTPYFDLAEAKLAEVGLITPEPWAVVSNYYLNLDLTHEEAIADAKEIQRRNQAGVSILRNETAKRLTR